MGLEFSCAREDEPSAEKHVEVVDRGRLRPGDQESLSSDPVEGLKEEVSQPREAVCGFLVEEVETGTGECADGVVEGEFGSVGRGGVFFEWEEIGEHLHRLAQSHEASGEGFYGWLFGKGVEGFVELCEVEAFVFFIEDGSLGGAEFAEELLDERMLEGLVGEQRSLKAVLSGKLGALVLNDDEIFFCEEPSDQVVELA